MGKKHGKRRVHTDKGRYSLVKFQSAIRTRAEREKASDSDASLFWAQYSKLPKIYKKGFFALARHIANTAGKQGDCPSAAGVKALHGELIPADYLT